MGSLNDARARGRGLCALPSSVPGDRPGPCAHHLHSHFLLHPEEYPARLGSPWVTPGFGECREQFWGSFGRCCKAQEGPRCLGWFLCRMWWLWCSWIFPPVFAFPWNAVKMSCCSWEGVVGVKCEGGTAKSCFSPVSARGNVSLECSRVATAAFWPWIGICQGGNHWDVVLLVPLPSHCAGDMSPTQLRMESLLDVSLSCPPLVAVGLGPQWRQSPAWMGKGDLIPTSPAARAVSANSLG